MGGEGTVDPPEEAGGVDANTSERLSDLLFRVFQDAAVWIGVGDQPHELGRDHHGLARGCADRAVVLDVGRKEVNKSAGVR